MIEEEHDFCPFIKENCRKDCTFLQQITIVSEDGIDEFNECVIFRASAMIAQEFSKFLGYYTDKDLDNHE